MKKNNDDFRKCDKCIKLEITPSGVYEMCQAEYDIPYPFSNKAYYDERMSGNQRACKDFKKI